MTYLYSIVSHNRNEIELAWSGITPDVKTKEELLIDDGETGDIPPKLAKSEGRQNADGVLNNSPFIKHVQTSHCPNYAWKGQ